MTDTLPPRPDLEWLRKAAKERLAEMRADDPAAKLHHAQLDVARRYGYRSWRALKAHVDTVSLDGQVVAAVTSGDAKGLARLLADHPARIDVTGGQWRRPLLHLAADEGHLECVDLLLRLGEDVDRRDQTDNATALHWAAQAGHLNVAKRLADAGADLDGDRDEHELGVIGWATCFQHVRREMADFLLARGARPTIFSAVALGREDLVRGLAERDPQCLSRQMSGFEHHRMPLHLATQKNRPDMIALLLELGADPSGKDSRGYTALDYVVPETDESIAERLAAAGAVATAHSPNRFESAVPILNVASVPAAIDYYVEKLGFRKEWDWGSPPDFACVIRDEVRIFLCQDGQGARGMWISVFVHDVDALYEDYQRSGAIIRQPPTSFPWGVREMNVEDIDGHRLRLGSDAEGTADDEPINEDP